MKQAPDLDRVFAVIDAKLDDAVAELASLVKIPSISAQPTHALADCAAAVGLSMERSGLSVRLLEGHGPPAVFGQRLVDPDLPTVLIYGHYDVQPVEPESSWQSPPFELTIRDGRMFGRGSSDNKGQHLAHLYGIRALLESAGETPVNVKMLIEGEEEIGSPHLAGLVGDHRELLQADLAITSDGPLHRSGRPQLVLGTRGQLGVEIVAHGANRDAHAGSLGGVLPDPARDLVRSLASLRTPAGGIAVPGFDESVRPITPAEHALLASLPLDVAAHCAEYGIAGLPDPEGPGYYERLMFQPTMTICGLSSGYSGPGMKTVLSQVAQARLDIRLVPDQDPDVVFGRLAAHLANIDRSLTVRKVSAVPPSRTPADHPVLSPLGEAVRRATGLPPYVVPSLGSTLPNYVFTETLGIPSVLIPYANHDQSNHAPDENMDLRRFVDGMRMTAAMLTRLGDYGH